MSEIVHNITNEKIRFSNEKLYFDSLVLYSIQKCLIYTVGIYKQKNPKPDYSVESQSFWWAEFYLDDHYLYDCMIEGLHA